MTQESNIIELIYSNRVELIQADDTSLAGTTGRRRVKCGRRQIKDIGEHLGL